MSNGHADYRASLDEELETGDSALDAHAVHLATLAEKKRLWWRNSVINLLLIGSWCFFAILLSVYNKWMFSPDHFGFPYPMFVTTLHMFVQFGLAATLRRVWPKRFRPEHDPTRKDYWRKVIPTGMTTALDIGLSNLSMKTITLSFYTMVKSSSLIFVLLFAFLFHLETPSLRLTAVILTIFTGVLLMVASETHFVLPGFILVLTASSLGGLRWSLTQILIRKRNSGLENPVATIFWLAPIGGVTLGVISAIFERSYNVLGKEKFFGNVGNTSRTLVSLFFPGTLAFCMILSEVSIIKRAGVVPMSIAGIAKEVTTISISAWLFNDNLTPLNIIGVAITAVGILIFTYHKYRKSIDSTIPLDAHGNPIVDEDDDGEGHAKRGVELEETERLTSSRSPNANDPDDTDADGSRVLFAVGDDAEDDADELRSIHSSKLHFANGDGRGERAAESTRLVARESIDVEREWKRNNGPGERLPDR